MSTFLVELSADGISMSDISDTGWKPLGRGVLHLDHVALWRRNHGLRHPAEAAMAKWLGPASASAAVKDCLLLHGNYGYAEEYGLEQRLRDVLAVEIADGTAQIQKIIIARERSGRDFVPYGRG